MEEKRRGCEVGEKQSRGTSDWLGMMCEKSIDPQISTYLETAPFSLRRLVLVADNGHVLAAATHVCDDLPRQLPPRKAHVRKRFRHSISAFPSLRCRYSI